MMRFTPEQLGMGRLFWALPDAVIVGDTRNGEIVLWNPAAERMFGYSADEAVGLSLEVLVPDVLREKHRQGLRHYGATGHGHIIDSQTPVEVPALCKDGRQVMVELRLSPIAELDSPSLHYVLAVIRDVTERARARAEIQILNEELERRVGERTRRLETTLAERDAILAQMVEGVVIADFDGRIIFANRSASSIIGTITIGDMVASAARQYLAFPSSGHEPGDDFLSLTPALHGETVIDAASRLQRSDGRAIIVRGSAAPVRTEEGTAVGAVAIFRDATVQHEVDSQKDAFLSLVAHELRTPITVVRGNLQLLGRLLEHRTPQVDRRLDVVHRQVDNLIALINDLLDLSRIQTGHMQCRLAPLNLTDLAHSVVDEMAILYVDRIVRLYNPGAMDVEGDPLRLRQVLVNLIDNAFQHGPSDTEVTITIELEGGSVVTYVRDEGPALPPEERARVFEHFYRLPTEKTETGGLGIGLHISRGIVEAHGGRIWVDDDDHSSFAFSLPALGTRAETEQA